jgi:superfamily II DNA or RNA helicase
MSKVTIRIHDEVNITVVGLHGDHITHFYNKYALFTANYFFNPKYKLGRWDGKIAHFSKAGKTFLYLLPEILKDLIRFHYEIVVDDQRTIDPYYPDPIDENIFAHLLHPDTGKPIILRDYQIEAVNNVLIDGNGTILAATSAGKTFICAAILQSYTKFGVKTITIVPDQNLIMQTIKTYTACEIDVGEYSGKRKTLSHQHIVSTWQALQHNPMLINGFDLVIVDEAHNLRGAVIKKIVCDHAAKLPYRFGVTGTLPKEPIDELAVKLAVGTVKYEIPAHLLIERGVLAKLDIKCLQLEENLMDEYDNYKLECTHNHDKHVTYKKFKEDYFAEYAAEKSYLQYNNERLEWIANKLIEERDNKGNVLCLVTSIPVGRKIASMIPGAICVNGADVKDPKKRQLIYDMFETNNDLIVIATVHIAGTGLSINRIFTLFAIDLGKSFTRVIQAIGRGLRTSDDKNSVTFIDICSDLKSGNKHLTDRIKYYIEAKYPYTKQLIKYQYRTLEI